MRKNPAWGILSAAVVGLVCMATRGAQDLSRPFEIGQRWQYRHEGPRPGSVEPNAIDGERILWVLSATEGPEGTQWVVEERFTHDEKVVGRLYVREDGPLETIEIENEKGEKARLRYDPPVPYQPEGMAVGDTRVILTTLRMDSANLALPSKTTMERLTDETVTTPAGDFTDCPHYRSVTTSTVDIKIAKIPITEERERWYHPTARGMVKEVYRRGPVKFLGWSRPGYAATSVLTRYDRQEPGISTGPANSAGAPIPMRQGPVPSKSDAPAVPATRLILPVMLLLALGGGLVLARRARARGR